MRKNDTTNKRTKTLSSNNDKTLQIFYGITSYPYGRKAVKVSKTELLQYLKSKI